MPYAHTRPTTPASNLATSPQSQHDSLQTVGRHVVAAAYQAKLTGSQMDVADRVPQKLWGSHSVGHPDTNHSVLNRNKAEVLQPVQQEAQNDAVGFGGQVNGGLCTCP